MKCTMHHSRNSWRVIMRKAPFKQWLFNHVMAWPLNTLSQKRYALACYNFDTHQTILLIFDRNVTLKVCNQMIVYFLASSNLTDACVLPGKTRKHENRICGHMLYYCSAALLEFNTSRCLISSVLLTHVRLCFSDKPTIVKERAAPCRPKVQRVHEKTAP